MMNDGRVFNGLFQERKGLVMALGMKDMLGGMKNAASGVVQGGLGNYSEMSVDQMRKEQKAGETEAEHA